MGRREEQREETWRDIRAAAWRLFDARGYDDVSIEEVAAAAGVSRTTFFNYFNTKEAVVLDPDPDDLRALERLLAEQADDLAAWPALTAVLVGLVSVAGTQNQARRRLTTEHRDLAHRGRELTDDLAARLRTWMRERRPEDPLGADLVVDLPLAALGTAWAAWPLDASVTTHVDLVAECLARAGPSWARG